MQQIFEARRTARLPRLGSCMLLVAVLFTSGCSHTQGGKHLSSSSYAATRKAVDALELAGKYRNSTAIIFGPKFQEARDALENVEHEIGNEPADAYAASQVRLCVEDLRAYRSSFDSRETVNRPMKEQLKGIRASEIKDPSDVIASDGEEFDDCMKTAKSYF